MDPFAVPCPGSTFLEQSTVNEYFLRQDFLCPTKRTLQKLHLVTSIVIFKGQIEEANLMNINLVDRY
jgi:hypothetical protein